MGLPENTGIMAGPEIIIYQCVCLCLSTDLKFY